MHRRAPVFPLLLIALTFALLACGKKQPEAGSFADVTLPLYGGGEYTLSGRDTAVTLVVFWATWCQPCLLEIPHLNEFQEKYADRGFKVVSINLDDPEANKILELDARYAFRYPVLLDDGTAEQAFGGLNALPTSFLVGRDGLVKLKFEGLYPARVVEEQIKKLL